MYLNRVDSSLAVGSTWMLETVIGGSMKTDENLLCFLFSQIKNFSKEQYDSYLFE